MNVLITGGSSGIGEEFAYQFAKKKKNIILVARNEERLKEIKKDIEGKYKVKCKYIISDLSKPTEINKLIKNIEKEDIEILVNNAGFGNRIDFNKSEMNIIEDMLHVHITTTTLLTRVVLEKMFKKNKGKIINVASIAGYLLTSKSNIIYNSTKRYIIHFSKCLQEEIKENKKNIKVQALCPGYTKTNFEKRAVFNNKLPTLPKFMHMETKDVVSKSIKCLENRKVVCIPGWFNRVIVFLLKMGVYK